MIRLELRRDYSTAVSRQSLTAKTSLDLGSDEITLRIIESEIKVAGVDSCLGARVQCWIQKQSKTSRSKKKENTVAEIRWWSPTQLPTTTTITTNHNLTAKRWPETAVIYADFGRQFASHSATHHCPMFTQTGESRPRNPIQTIIQTGGLD